MCSLADWLNTADMVLTALIIAVMVLGAIGISIYRCVGNVLP